MTTGYSAVSAHGPGHAVAVSQTPHELIGHGEHSHDVEGTEADLDGDDDDDDEGSYAGHEAQHNMKQETTVKSGYLEKKGEKRKAWKKRWFVLRSSKLSYYKNDKEYQLLRFIDIGDIKTVAAVEMKKSLHAFGIVTPKRTFYVRASSKVEMEAWIEALNDVKTQYAQSSTMTQDMAAMQLSTADAAHAQQPHERNVDAERSGSDSRDARAITIGIPGHGTFASPAQPRPIPGSSAFSPLTITSESEAGTTADRYGMSYNSSAAGHSLSGSPGRIDTNVPFVVAGQSPSGQHSGSELSDYGIGHQRRPSAGFASVPRQRSTSGARRFGSGAGYDSPASPSMAPSNNHILSSSDEEDEWDEEEFADQVMPLPAMSGQPGPQHNQQGAQQQHQHQPPQALSVTTPGNDLSRDPNKVITQGYLMKQSGRRKVWRKRWFVLTSSRLHYARSHMDGKAHRQIPIASILDAIEYEAKKAAPVPASGPTSPSIGSPMSNPFAPDGGGDRHRDVAATAASGSTGNEGGGGPAGPPDKPERRGSMVAAAAGVASNMSAGMGVGSSHKKRKENCFQIITPKRTYILCAPSEDEEIKWISAVKTLINRQRNAQTPGLNTPMSPTGGVGGSASSFPFHLSQPPSSSAATGVVSVGSAGSNAPSSATSTTAPTTTSAASSNVLPSGAVGSATAQGSHLPSITAAAQALSPSSRQNSSTSASIQASLSSSSTTTASAGSQQLPTALPRRQRTPSSTSQQSLSHTQT